MEINKIRVAGSTYDVSAKASNVYLESGSTVETVLKNLNDRDDSLEVRVSNNEVNISTLQTELTTNYVHKVQKGTANGVATLDSNTKIPSAQLPVATATQLGGVKSSNSIAIASDGVATVIDNAHTHTIANVTNLQESLDSKIPNSQKGVANGVATLDNEGKVPAIQLPSYVDDVIEGYFFEGKFYKEYGHTTLITGETGKIYVDLVTEKTYRWSGSMYVVISETLAIGETSSTAFSGDKGKVAYEHAVAKGGAFNSGFYKIATNDQGHVIAATSVTKEDITTLGVPAQDTTYGVFNGATSATPGTSGLVPKPNADDVEKYLKADGTWTKPFQLTASYTDNTLVLTTI